MREPDLSELSAGEAALGLATAAAAYFFPPLLVITLPALGLVVARRITPGTGDGALKLLAAPVRAAQEYVTTGTLPQFSLARRPEPQLAAPQLVEKATPAAPAAAGGPLKPAAWLRAVNDRPDDSPHLLVTGTSGSGKTTFVSAALGQRAGRVVVVTPKVTPGSWRGAEVVTLSDDLSYEPLATAIAELQTEAKRRAVALKNGERLEPMTVVLDELPELVAEVPTAGPFAVRLSRWGRELGMRQVVLATSDDALNIKGWASTRPNYVHAHLDRPTEDGTRSGWLDDGQARRPLDLATVKAGAERAELRPWREAEPAPVPVSNPAPAVDMDMLAMLDEMLAKPVSSASQSVDTLAAMSLSSPMDMDEDTGHGAMSNGATVVLPAGHGPTTINLSAVAGVITTPAPAEPTPPSEPAPSSAELGARRRRARGGYGLNAKRRRQLAEQYRLSERKAELQAAYVARKAEGWSYNRAWRELKGNSTETRDWWRAAPGPATTKEAK